MGKPSEFTKTWNESFMNYAADMVKFYNINKEGFISCMKFESFTWSLNQTYYVLVKEGSIKQIEDLDKEKKNELWAKAKTVSENKNHCISICRAIYLMEKITE